MDMTNESTHRIPPQEIESEQLVLGSALLSRETADIISEEIKPEHFYKPSHSSIFEAIRKLNRSLESVDLVSVMSQLKKDNRLSEIGGPVYLSMLIDIVPVTSNIRTHVKAIIHAHGLRNVIRKASELANKCYSNEIKTSTEAMEELERVVFDSSGYDGESQKGFVHIGDVVTKCFETIEGLSNGSVTSLGLNTGYTDIDRMTLGLQPSDLIILAGRPSQGKTALGMNIVENITAEGGKVGVVSLEMDKTSLVMRLLSSVAKIDSYILKSGRIKDTDWPKLTHAMSKLKEMGIYVDDGAALSPYEIRSRARRLMSQVGVDLIVVDYLQMSNTDARSEQEEISIVSRNMKSMAKELNIPVLALSQLNRACESRPDKRPMLSDLRGSGSIEQDADVIAFVYRDEMYNKSVGNPLKGIAEVIFGKQRNGHTGSVKLAFTGAFTRFENLITMHETVY